MCNEYDIFLYIYQEELSTIFVLFQHLKAIITIVKLILIMHTKRYVFFKDCIHL